MRSWYVISPKATMTGRVSILAKQGACGGAWFFSIYSFCHDGFESSSFRKPEGRRATFGAPRPEDNRPEDLRYVREDRREAMVIGK